MKMKILMEKIREIETLEKRIKNQEQMERMRGPNMRIKQHILELKADLNRLLEQEIP